MPRFETSVDRFASCFEAPLFTKSLLDREIFAVHSEFEMNSVRTWDQFEQVFKCTGNPGHGFCRSMPGSKASIKDITHAHGVDTQWIQLSL